MGFSADSWKHTETADGLARGTANIRPPALREVQLEKGTDQSMSMTPNERPWYGSSRKDDYRLLPTDSNADENALWSGSVDQSHLEPNKSYGGMEYIGSGWEWSTFRAGNEVVKIPAGRFDEIADPRYMFHSEINYQKLLRYVDEEFVAATRFLNDHIQQEFIEAQTDEWVQLSNLPQKTKRALIRLFSDLLPLLYQEDWLPDLDIIPKDGWLERKNWMIDQHGTPKIFDFTAYYDVFRLNESRLKREKPDRARHLLKALKCLE